MSDILVSARRGPLMDLHYYGNVAVCDHTGKLLWYAGDPLLVAYARSSAKPMQAFSVFESGAVTSFGLSGNEIAALCASHSGEDMHVNAVRSILSKAGVPESALQCGVHYPMYRPAEIALIQADKKPSTVHCNCSGKHAGMLITAAAYGENYDDYTNLNHPVQQRILHNIADICEYPAEKIVIGVDGCGVPVHAMPLRVFAHGVAKLAKPEVLGGRAHIIERIAQEMNAYPEMMSGTGRSCAGILRAGDGKLLLKSGADGYYMCAVRGEGIGVAVKMINNAPNVSAMVLIETLRQLGVLSEAQVARLTPPFYNMEIRNNRKDLTGTITPQFMLKKAEC